MVSDTDSESSDDDNLAHLREAADPDLINDGMFKFAGERGNDNRTDSSKISIRSIFLLPHSWMTY